MNSITIIFLLAAFFLISCSAASEQNSANQDNPIAALRLDTLEMTALADSILFIDTILPLIGGIKVYLKNNDLYFRGEKVNNIAKLHRQDQFLNSNKLNDEYEYPTNLIEVYDNGKWSRQQIVNIGDSLVVFVLRSDEHVPHFYSVKCTEDSCIFLCFDGIPDCAIHSSTPSCVVLERMRKRLLKMPHGVASDLEREIEYKAVYVYQLGNRTMLNQGVLKYKVDWKKKDFLRYNTTDEIERWFLPYLRVADRHVFDDYLNALPLK